MAETLAINGGEPVRTRGFTGGNKVGAEELKELVDVIYSGNLNRFAGGVKVDQFEAEFAEIHGAKHAVASTSGTSALHVAVGMINPAPGDEIITGPITDMGSIIPILYQGAIPVFAECAADTFNMDPTDIEAKITDRTVAIMAIHLFGNPCDMDAIMDLAARHNLPVIEDCSQAHLSEFKGKLVGTMGDIGCFSLQQSKQITTGDGGIVVTDAPDLADEAYRFHDKYYDRSGGNRPVDRFGMNYRMSELVGAVALAQLRKLDRIISRRCETAEALMAGIDEIPGINPATVHPKATHTWWRVACTIDEDELGCDAKAFTQAVVAEGLPLRVHTARGEPICMLPAFQNYAAYGGSNFPWEPPYGRRVEYRREDYPNTNWAMENVWTASWNEGFTLDDVADILHGLRKISEYYRARG